MPEIVILVLVVAVFTLIQSMFGVGLLLLGTPTLLFLGYEYTDTLGALVPCSLSISLLQIAFGRALIGQVQNLFLCMLPALAAGLFLILKIETEIEMKTLVGLLLLVVVVFRVVPSLEAWQIRMVSENQRISLVLIGCVHGLSNMGGGPLAAYMSSLYRSKQAIRANVAAAYFLLALAQFIILYIFNGFRLAQENYILIALSIMIYLVFSRFLVNSGSDRLFHRCLNGLLLFYVVLCFAS